MKAILLFIFSIVGILAYSQAPTFDWAFGNGQITTKKITTDANNNILFVGSFAGTQDFDPGIATNEITSVGQSDIFISKFDSNGNFLWTKTIGGVDSEKAIDIHQNSLGQLVIVGYFNLSVDFDPSNNISSLVSNGSNDIFILKLDSNGNFITVKQIGGNGWDEVFSLEIDNNDDIYITGQFSNSVDFDPSIATNLLNANGRDIFVAKYTNNLNYSWAKSFNNSTSQYGGLYNVSTSIVVDQSYNVIVVGEFAGTVDFDPSSTVNNSITVSAISPFMDPQKNTFIVKLSNSGNLIRAEKILGVSPFLTIDNENNLILGGRFNSSSIDFDLNQGTQNLTITGNLGLYLLKMNNNFDFGWVKFIGQQPQGILPSVVCDNLNNIYFSESFSGSGDFNPSSSSNILTSMGSSNAFITKLKKTGDFIWAINYGSTFQNGGTFVNSITLDSDNSIINSGSYGTSADMDPGQGNFELQGGGNYIMKLRNCNPIVENLNIVNCGNYIGSNNVTYSTSGIYNYNTTNINGCDSIITLNLTILPTQTNSVSISRCDSYTSPQGNNYSSSGTYTETYSNVNGCDSIVTINLTITTIQNIVSISSCGNYISPLGNNYSNSGTYQETYTTNNGCDSIVTIQLTVNNSSTVNETETVCSSYLSPSGNTYILSGQYYDTLLTSLGCDSIIITQLTILTPTQSSISPVVCSSYTSPSGIVYNQTGTYIDTLQNQNGCDSIITINLSVVGTLNVNAGPDITICSGESITLNGAGATTYSWSNGVSNNTPFSPTVTTNYEVIGTDGNGCSGKDSILVSVNNPPSIAFNSILPDCEGGVSGSVNVSVTGSSPFSYQWSNGSNTQNLLNVSAGNYGVTVTDANDCSSDANFNLQDGEGDCLIVPTGFSPNGDNENDKWNIIGIEQFTNNQVQVFNRWGQTVFESNGTAVNWDGSYQDKQLPVADYYFVVDLGNGQVFNGTLTIKY